MNEWRTTVEKALQDFVTVAALSQSPISLQELLVEFLEAPHKPPASLPAGKMAIYGFWYSGEWLKIGMAGPKSQARYTSQHYNPASAGSTLAASLIGDPRMSGTPGFNAAASGEWIRSHTNRVNILVPNEHRTLLLALLEAFLHVRLKPRYEK